MEKYITKNGIKYELRGEQYYPMLEISEQTNYEIGKYGHGSGNDERRGLLLGARLPIHRFRL